MLNPKVYDILNKKIMNRVTIDIDSVSALPKALLKAVDKFGYERVKLYRTPSGTGFRIEIKGEFTPLENIFIRCALEDDPYRLRYALHRFLLSADINALDVAFYIKSNIGKYSGKISEIPLKDVVPQQALELYRQGKLPEAIQLVKERVMEYIKPLKLYTIVIPTSDIEKIKQLPMYKMKLLKDPYYDDRVIVYVVTSVDIVSILKSKGVHVITYRVKDTLSKSHDESEL